MTQQAKYPRANPDSLTTLVMRLITEGGAIVGTGTASTLEIADAQARGDFYVTPGGYGLIHRSQEWKDKAEKAITFQLEAEDAAQK